MSQDTSTKLLNLCGLWKCTSKAGNTYWRGRLGGAVVLIMENKYKKNDTQPDLIVYLAPKEGPKSEDTATSTKEKEDQELEDNLPF